MIHFFYNGGEMKRLTVSVILLFIFVLALPAALMGGGNVGADVSYFRHYNRSLSNVESQEVVIGISNDNYFVNRKPPHRAEVQESFSYTQK